MTVDARTQNRILKRVQPADASTVLRLPSPEAAEEVTQLQALHGRGKQTKTRLKVLQEANQRDSEHRTRENRRRPRMNKR